jgi:energy-coupling factor transporter transmembrane protein EcfT
LGLLFQLFQYIFPLASNTLSRATLLDLTTGIRGYRLRARTRLRERTFGIADGVAVPLMAAGGILFAYAFFTLLLS